MVLLNNKIYSPSSYVGSPHFTRMEKTVRTKTSSGEDYPTLEQVGLVPLSSFGKKAKSSLWIVASVMQEDQAHPEKDFRNGFDPYLLTDDVVFHGGLVAYTRNQKDRASLTMPHNDRALWHFINLGSRDMPLTNKPWDASTRSMRFATSLADRLWVRLDREHARVRLLLTLLDGVNSNHFCC